MTLSTAVMVNSVGLFGVGPVVPEMIPEVGDKAALPPKADKGGHTL